MGCNCWVGEVMGIRMRKEIRRSSVWDDVTLWSVVWRKPWLAA